MARIRHLLQRIGDALLWLLSSAGVVCIVLVILAFGFNLTLIMFKTGSMSPTIPAGSVALVREIPASEVRIGDVVTVDIEGRLPITHRVTSVAPGPAPDQRIITMRGDANEADDPSPYVVSTVRLVLGSVPELARFIVWTSHPVVLAAITVGASAIVTWAFWPRRRLDDEATGHGHPHSSGLPRQVTAPGRTAHAPAHRSGLEPQEAAAGRQGAEHGRHGGASHRVGGPTVAAVLLTASLAASGVLAGAEPAAATIEEDVVHGTYLTLTSLSESEMHLMTPGMTVHWQVGVTVHAPEPGEVHLALSGTGSERLDLGATVRACSVRWVGGTCAGQQWQLPAHEPLELDGVERPLMSMPSNEERWVLFTVTMPDDARPEPGDHVTQQIHATGHGETVIIGPGEIATTGSGDMPNVIFLSLGAVLAGLFIAFIARLAKRRGRGSAATPARGSSP